MKRLKTVLILLFALVMSLGLFACGGGEDEHTTHVDENPKDGKCDVCGEDVPHDHVDADENGKCDICGTDMGGTTEPGEYRNIRVRPSEIALTDSDEQSVLDSEYGKVVVTATDYDGMTTDFTLNDCDISGTVTLHEVGEYTLNVHLKSDDSKVATLTVTIKHNWGASSNGLRICQYSACGAREETREEDVVIHYGTFHEGTDATIPQNSLDSGLWARKETKVYTNYKADTSAVSEFGLVNGKKVPTLTVGQLEPGTTITIRGKAQTATDANGPWNHANEYWNFPLIGIADRYNNTIENSDHKGYTDGVSVIVRQEGWVLYNGIGENAANLLGGIMGGSFTSAGGWRNYGSHIDAANDSANPGTPGTAAAGYTKAIPTDWSSVGDWWAYSSGEIMQSGSYYGEAADVEYTWNYREDGVIELTYAYGTNYATVLKAYIKVPASSVGYYDTILHGDYSDMTITESVITTKRTPKTFRYNGLKTNANKTYAENMQYDATTLNVEVEYEQAAGKFEPLQIVNSQVYYYNGTLSRAELAANADELNSLDSEKWISLGNHNLVSGDKIYKIHLVKAGKSFVQLLGENDIKVVANKVASAAGSDVTIDGVTFYNNGKVGELPFSFDAEKEQIVLALSGGNVQKLDETQTAKFTDLNGATRYVALRINAAELGAAFTANGLTAKDGTENVPVCATVSDAGDLYLVLALKKASDKIVISGAQATEIVLNLSELQGFMLESAVEGTLKLNAGGELTLTYNLPANAKADELALAFGSSIYQIRNAFNADGSCKWTTSPYTNGNYTFTNASLQNNKLTITVKVAGANLANYAPAQFELRYTSGSTFDAITDVIDYTMEMSDTVEGFIAGEGHYAYVTESGKLNVVKAFPSDNVENGTVSGKVVLNINDGNLDTFKTNGLLTIVYRIENGELVLVNAPAAVSGFCQIVGTFGDERGGADKGAYVVLTVDLATLGINGDYYFDFNNGETFNSADEAKPASINKVSGTKISQETVAANECKTAIIIEGTCQQEGLYAWEITKSGKTVFYAKASVGGGVHDDSDGDNICDLCGSTIGTVSLTHDENSQKNELRDGQFVEISGQYNSSTHAQAYNGIETNVRQASGDAFYVRVRNDGFYAREVGADEQITLDSNSTPANTCNGVPNGIDGTPIDAATDYLDAKKEGFFKVYASYVEGKVTVITKLWTKDQEMTDTPYFQYTVMMTVVSKAASIMVNFRLDNWNGVADVSPEIQTNGECKLVKGNVSNSTIESVAFADVSGHAAPTGMTIANAGNKVTLTGNAPMENKNYYVAFKVTFQSAIDSSTDVYVRNADGSSFANATATLNTERTEMLIYLPLTAGTAYTTATLDFVNFAGNTMQGDIVVDLSNILLSDVEVTADKQDLKLAGDTFTLTFTGTIPATAKLAIGADAVALADLAAASATSPVAINSLFSVTAYNASTHAVTVKYAGVQDYTKDVAEVEFLLTDENDVILNRISVYPNSLEGLAQQIETSGWYILANGGTLVLVSDKAEAETLPVIINAGKAYASKFTIGMQELGFKGGKFVDSNVATKASVLMNTTINGKTVTAIVITVADLEGIGIAQDGAYGVMLATEGAEKYYYAVAANRTITEQNATAGTSEKEIGTHSCTEPGKKAKTNADESFYWDFEVTPAHSYPAAVDSDGNYVCTVCGAILHSGNAVSTYVSVPEGTTDLDEKGMSVSFWLIEAGNDWDAIGVWTNFGKFKIALPNIQANNQGTDVSSDEAIAALRTKIGNGNAFPSSAGVITNGYNWDAISSSKNVYVTITIGLEAISFYMDGVQIFSFPATMAFPDSANGGTMGDFIEAFLLAAQKGGVTVATPETAYNGSISAKDALIEYGKAYTADEAAARYNAYISEKYYYPTHTHAYGDDDKCTCGELNPNHGNTSEGGKAHAWDDTDHCTMCGIFNPDHQHKDEHGPDGTGEPDGICDVCDKPVNHQHTFVNGVCSDCHYVCAHTFTTEEGECSVCGQVTGKQLSSEELGDTTNGWTDHSKMYTMTKPAEGKVLEIVYSAKFDTDTTAKDWDGVVTRFFDGPTSQAFLQGNCFVLNPDSEPWGAKANADRTIAAYGDVSKEGYFCRVTVLWQGTSIKVTYELWTAEDDLNVGPDKTGSVTFSNLEKDTYNAFFGLDGVTSTNAKLVVNEYNATESGNPGTPVTPETGTKNVPASEIPSWVAPFQPTDVATLTEGTTVKITGQFADAGTATWNGLMYFLRNGQTNQLLYVFRQAGDCADVTGEWAYGQGTVTPGFMGDPNAGETDDDEKANTYIALKKNAKFEVVATYINGTVTITVTVFGADDASTEDDQVLSVVLSNMTVSSYKLALALDSATLTEAGLTVTTTVAAD